MIIDKTTGKGCAQSIASKEVVTKLVAEGILDKPIFRKVYKTGCDLLWVTTYEGDIYVMREKYAKLSDEPLWAPSFIDAGIWKQAVGRFQSFRRLDRNVEKYLLPEMEGYIQSISDEELISITRDFLISNGVCHRPIAQRAGKTYLFNKDEVFSIGTASLFFRYKEDIKLNLFNISHETCFNMNVWHKAVSQFEVGMTLNECIRIFLKTEMARGVPRATSDIDRLVQYIAPARYERVPENKNELTFDRIHITVGLPRYQFNSWEDLQDEVKKYHHEIYQRVIRKLEAERPFKKYGVPLNSLVLSDVMLLYNYSIEFIFEHKCQEIDH